MLWTLGTLLITIAALNPDQIDLSISRVNNTTYRTLEKLVSKDSYSLVKTKDLGEFSSPSKCTLLSCLIKKSSIFNEEYINLLEVKEAYTGYKTNDGSAETWRKIWEISGEDSLLPTLVSGLQFSIFTHLSSFHKKFFTVYFPNPALFHKKFQDKHRLNFYLTYLLLRNCVGGIDMDCPEMDKDLLDVVQTIRAQGSTNWVRQTLDLEKTIQRVDKMIDLLKNINCEKCQLWGTIQLKGLRAALKVFSGSSNLDNLERFFLANLFMRLSVSVRENIKLRRYKFPLLVSVSLYWMEILSFATSFLIILLVSRVRNKFKSKIALKSCM
ncbi:endoplasmic reticulum membrane-associated oxidoreductin [Encephalitozoon intestinalis ATCC 50506]|uniref:Endoplasmic reticulum membrane-associated oxidoreductin n=1 Tax=Encephalitozoon intestinalis (strain ATCC 50506) TaxID=876142 RepID=E0S6G8_ENCIT|nr:endoplasmic reticulum membrane-associated oxidoreductin [Encephalitozoon intestinalis ATCC 50506]ADM11303.1 endoplasmic reticulum membrane-associated oxidoreductin [Encephalitozoon intestinalis ATCC 50506]UTX44989.1 endoplasmic reticulum membrane-associated oxidoreductin [Encephalitozoon intestinalis]